MGTRKSRALALVAASLLLLAAGPALGRRAVTMKYAGNRVFVAVLPEIGTVYARYDCAHGRRFSLGIRVTGPQTTEVRFRAARFARVAEVQPGDPTRWFRSTTRRVEWLAAAAGGEDGTVVGSVRVVGYSRNGLGACDDIYDPPRVTTQTFPRNYPPPGFTLRKLIG